MTTAHKPTWNPARGHDDRGGRLNVPSQQYSSRDLPGHTKLKYRKPGQNTAEEISQRNLKEELEERERRSLQKKNKQISTEEKPMIEAPPEESSRKRKHDQIQEPPLKVTKDQDPDADDEDSGNSSTSDNSDDDEDTAELMRELEKIKKERELESSKKEQELQQRDLDARSKSILTGNPLLNQQIDAFTVKKKWYDDVVFKNQSRGEPKQKKPRFINDTIRNDFHRRFLNKYIK
eukprot:TRINITY_DN14812_c0_g1_i1.p1 TRINITY_DN14812_c0_g1~~TRINITY_DN14812_c0_g1_i1.p1  ORF type:complete len:234 (+),score=67.13 TRINITY_DN14812_c0_g1_i1:54-755(+)